MIDPAGFPVIDGDADALARYAHDLVATGGNLVDIGERVHTTWQQLAPVYQAPETDQLLTATGPVRQVSASVGEDIAAIGGILGTYATELRIVQLRLDVLRAEADALVGVAVADPTTEQADQSNALLSQVNVTVADFEDAQRRCANAINALYGGTSYRADDGDGKLDRGEYGSTAADLDAAARDSGVPWGQPAQAEGNGWLSDLVHDGLDVVGLIPVVGEVADGINAGLYVVEGDYANAALSAAAMVPIIGWGATGGKFAVKGFRRVRSVDEARMWATGRPRMVPRGADKVKFRPDQNFPGGGQKYEWKVPGTIPGTQKAVRYHAHGIDPRRLPTENAGKGPIYRVQIGSKWLGADGKLYPRNSMKPNSGHFDPLAANMTHIPYPRDLPPPGAPREFVPNVAAMGDPTGGGEE